MSMFLRKQENNNELEIVKKQIKELHDELQSLKRSIKANRQSYQSKERDLFSNNLGGSMGSKLLNSKNNSISEKNLMNNFFKMFPHKTSSFTKL